MLHRLVELPFPYFCEPRLLAVLMPTLLCGCLADVANLHILSSRLSPEHLARYLRGQIRAYPPSAEASSETTHAGNMK